MADEQTQPPPDTYVPMEEASSPLPGDELGDALTESALAFAGGEFWRVVPHRSSRPEIPMLGFPSPAEWAFWYTSEADALEAARQLAVQLRDAREEDKARRCGPALFVAVCGPFANKKLATRAVQAHRAIDRSIRYEASCVVSDANTREPHVVVRAPTSGNIESFASRFPGGVVPWQRIADDIARRNGATGGSLTLSEHGLTEMPADGAAASADSPGGHVTRSSHARGGVRIQLGRTAKSRARTVTDQSIANSDDPDQLATRAEGRRILTQGRVDALTR